MFKNKPKTPFWWRNHATDAGENRVARATRQQAREDRVRAAWARKEREAAEPLPEKVEASDVYTLEGHHYRRDPRDSRTWVDKLELDRREIVDDLTDAIKDRRKLLEMANQVRELDPGLFNVHDTVLQFAEPVANMVFDLFNIVPAGTHPATVAGGYVKVMECPGGGATNAWTSASLTLANVQGLQCQGGQGTAAYPSAQRAAQDNLTAILGGTGADLTGDGIFDRQTCVVGYFRSSATARNLGRVSPAELTNPNTLRRHLPRTNTGTKTPQRETTKTGPEPISQTAYAVSSMPSGRGAGNGPPRSISATPTARPQGRTRERKGKGGKIMADIVDKIAEAAEVVDCMYKALPTKVQKRWDAKAPTKGRDADSAGQYGIDGADYKMAALYHNYNSIDLNKAMTCIAGNQIEDALYGKAFQGLERTRPRNWRKPGGFLGK
nr:MAG: hypothetical protein [Microvirus sp.]